MPFSTNLNCKCFGLNFKFEFVFLIDADMLLLYQHLPTRGIELQIHFFYVETISNWHPL